MHLRVKHTHSHDGEVIYCCCIISSEGLFTHLSFYCQSMGALGRLTIGAGCMDRVTFIPDFAAASFSTISHTHAQVFIPAQSLHNTSTSPLGVNGNKMDHLSELLSNKSSNYRATLTGGWGGGSWPTCIFSPQEVCLRAIGPQTNN